MIFSKPMEFPSGFPMETGPPRCARPRSVAPARGAAAPSGADDRWPGPGRLEKLGDFPWSMDWFKGKFTGNHGFYHQI